MSWPADHPLRVDRALEPWAGAARAILAEGRFIRVLRHLEGRRVASLVEMPQGPAVLKVFARPRARGNDRRLRLLAASSAGDLVPRALGVDPTGHVSLVEWSAGRVYDRVDDSGFVRVARSIGAALRSLHCSGTKLDRSWTYDDETTQLRRRAATTTSHEVERIIAATADLASEPLVPAHRDCHPRQIVVCDDGVRWIDLDDAALAPAALDVGNFVAHMRRDECLGRRSRRVTEGAIQGVLDGYGPIAGDLEGWTRLALVRLAGLAETRHGQPRDRQRLLALTR